MEPLLPQVSARGLGQGAILKEPIGVVAAITPFNFPLYLNLVKVMPALAVGYTVVLKPSPLTPLEALVLGEIADAVELPPGVLNVVTGDVAASEHLTTHPGVDMVSFTGSDAVGKQIMGQAAKGLKKVLLELGGKSPNIVFAGSDVDKFAFGAAFAFTIHAGQGCALPTRILAERSVYDEVVEKVDRRARPDPGRRPDEPEDRHGPAHPRGAARAGRALRRDRHRRGRAHRVRRRPSRGPRPRASSSSRRCFADVDSSMTVAQDEIFGPVGVAIPFDDEDDAVRIANDTRYGLAAGIWHPDPCARSTVAQRVQAGTVTINGGGGGPHLWGPFGGYKHSGHRPRVRRLRAARVHAAQDGDVVGRTAVAARRDPAASVRDRSARRELRAVARRAPAAGRSTVAADADDARAPARLAAHAARGRLGRHPLAGRVRRARRVGRRRSRSTTTSSRAPARRRCSAGRASRSSGPTLMAHGTDEQRARWMPRILVGDDVWCQLFSEPGAGSDLACAVDARRPKSGDAYRVTGQKVWSSYATFADMGIALVRTDPDAPPHKGISMLAIPMDAPGRRRAAAAADDRRARVQRGVPRRRRGAGRPPHRSRARGLAGREHDARQRARRVVHLARAGAPRGSRSTTWSTRAAHGRARARPASCASGSRSRGSTSSSSGCTTRARSTGSRAARRSARSRAS